LQRTTRTVDDDDGVRKVVGQLLAHLAFEVTAANSGPTGLALFGRKETHFDFVVLNWVTPELSGEQVFKALREIDPAMPVILISGYIMESLGAEEEHVARVQKPMTLAQLRDAVLAVTDTAAPHALGLSLPKFKLAAKRHDKEPAALGF
jgi:two-component system, cell cycle sensor histidine kinase and response regulator CckA